MASKNVSSAGNQQERPKKIGMILIYLAGTYFLSGALYDLVIYRFIPTTVNFNAGKLIFNILAIIAVSIYLLTKRKPS